MFSRITRIALGSVMIGVTMAASGSLGQLAFLPLLAIYPLLTGLFGEDLLDGLFANWVGGYDGVAFRPSIRLIFIAVGVVGIGAMMASPGDVGGRAVLALLAVYPLMIGLFCEDPLTAVFHEAVHGGKDRARSGSEAVSQAVSAPRLVHQRELLSATRGHATGHEHHEAA